MEQGKKKRRILWILGLLLLLLLTVVVGLWLGGRQGMKKNLAAELPAEESDADLPAQEESIIYEGKRYRYNADLITALFMGIDQSIPEEGGTEWGQSGRADSIFLAAFDQKSGRVDLIAISRDTMTPIEAYDADGAYLGTVNDHLSLGYLYGNGGKASCEMMVRNVSRLFYGLPINLYAAVDLDAVPLLNDAVGGVTVTTLDEDLNQYDSTRVWKTGEQVHLVGKMARTYVQGRDTGTDGSNNSRMARQKQYLTGFAAALRQTAAKNPAALLQLYQTLNQSMVTNVGASQAVYLASQALKLDFSEENIYAMPGENRYSGEYDEFYVDDEALYRLILDVFYTEVEA